ncbi:DUF4097 family beta strand repeat-containing protein [Lachnospira pectinoschiza]|uniref:Putative adhesin n=1 Tax=Lachnospira pectinoschiza TaxID=28052 RepID=A0A1G9TFI9_9FIRM|nr:DUF4097 family beta strand repeat-containing protein [Lachnospira pectinoschiza]SDM46549.1 Putative adhesin [Lachnospira pectinoschiza]
MSNKTKKKYKLVLYTITLVAILIGLYIHVIRYSIGGALGKNLSQDFTGEEVNSIELDTDTATTKIVYGDEFNVKYSVSRGSDVKVELEDGKLNVKENSSTKVVGISFLASESGVITITLPYNTNLDKIDVDLAAGNLNIEDINSEEIDIKSDVGNTKLNGITTEKLNIDSSVGNVKITDGSADDCTISVNTGNIKITDCDIETGSCTSQVGNIKISGNVGDLKASSKLGNVKINGDN